MNSVFDNGGMIGRTLDFSDQNTYTNGKKMNSGVWSQDAVYGALYSTALFDFTSHTFTNCGVTGYDGPTLNQCKSEYSLASWSTDTAFFNVVSQGIQEWTVPVTGIYTINAKGAQGGYNTSYAIRGGYGADIQIDIELTEGDVLKIVVGQYGLHVSSAEGSGGGGGSFVYTGAIGGSGLIIAAAGGGGTDDGTSAFTQQGGELCGGSSARSDFRTTLDGNNQSTSYINNGQEGAFNGGSTAYGPGAGWLSDLYSRVGDTTYYTAGKSITTPNFQGGTSPGYSGGSYGGFGGGGANYDDGGAGGGFTGGSATSSAGSGTGGSFYAHLSNAYYTSDYAGVSSNYLWNGLNGNTSSTPSNGSVTITLL